MEHVQHIQRRTFHNFELIEDQLWRSTGERTLQELSGAFSLLERAFRAPGLVLEDHEAGCILNHLQCAFVEAVRHLPREFTRMQISSGFRSLEALIAFARLPFNEREQRGRRLHDHRARLRIFRNALESARLEAEIAERAAADRRAVIEGLAALGVPFAIGSAPPSASALG